MKQRGLLLALAGTLFASSNAFAEAGDWLVRVRAVNVDPKNSSSPVAGVGVSSKTIPEVDISYFFTPNIAAELVLTYPQEHDVTLNGAKLGTLKELPPTLLVQYHFAPGSGFNPYVGVGINHTLFSSVDIPGFSVSSSSTGGALQIGADIPLGSSMSLNFDVKKIYMKTDVNTATGAKLTTLDINPVLIGVGLGWKF